MKPSDLARKQHDGDYQGRSTIFFNKLFEIGDYKNSFQVKDGIGLVRVHEVIFKYKAPPPSKDKKLHSFRFECGKASRTNVKDVELYQKFFESVCIEGFRGGANVELRASSLDKRVSHWELDLDLADLVKTDEFGGRGPGGKKRNFGLEYEEALAATWTAKLNGLNYDNLPWAAHVDVMDAEFKKKSGNKGLTYVEHAGGANESRPLKLKNGGVVVAPGGQPVDGPVGNILKDILVQYGGTPLQFTPSATTYYVSVKYGPTLAFFNSGVQGKKKDSIPFFPTKDLENNTIPSAGQNLLDMFNIDHADFIKIFKDFGKPGNVPSPNVVSTTLDAQQLKHLKAMTFTGVGYGYWMAHFLKGKFHFFEVDKNYATAASNVTGSKVELQYGGTGGDGKRINMLFSTPKYDFSFNIRNKQGGVWPSHTNGDYTPKY